MSDNGNNSTENKVEVIKINSSDFNKTKILVSGKDETIIVIEQKNPNISK